jgi:hypothetical protein
MAHELPTFTLVHVAISLIAIFAGFIVVFGMLAAKRMNGMTAIFLLFTVLTSVTGFFFPFHGITPAIVLGIMSMIVLAIAIFARYARHLAGGWRRTYAITAVIALYFNFFVLIVQLFEKVPALHVLAPTGTEPPFKIAQAAALIFFIVLAIFSAKRFRSA